MITRHAHCIIIRPLMQLDSKPKEHAKGFHLSLKTWLLF